MLKVVFFLSSTLSQFICHSLWSHYEGYCPDSWAEGYALDMALSYNKTFVKNAFIRTCSSLKHADGLVDGNEAGVGSYSPAIRWLKRSVFTTISLWSASNWPLWALRVGVVRSDVSPEFVMTALASANHSLLWPSALLLIRLFVQSPQRSRLFWHLWYIMTILWCLFWLVVIFNGF